jgi:hypothetical protein
VKDSSLLKRRSKKLLLLGALLTLAGCADEAAAPVINFVPLQYSYLPKLRLNVGTVEVADHSAPVGPQDVASSSPAVPAAVLAQMARDRLFPAGTSGRADFVIDQASLVRDPNGALSGHMAVHLDILSADGARAGFAAADVSRQHVPGSEPEDGSANLYLLTKQMMADMNVELEYQIKRSLSAYLVAAGSAPAPVMAQPLQAPGVVQAVPPPPPLPPGAPDAEPSAQAPDGLAQDGYQDPAAPPPQQQMSPPPGFLQLPPGAPQ